MYYKYQYPSISFILVNADRPEPYREQTRHCPFFFPAPPVLWIPDIPGRKSRIIVGVRYLLPIFSFLSFSLQHERARRLYFPQDVVEAQRRQRNMALIAKRHAYKKRANAASQSTTKL